MSSRGFTVTKSIRQQRRDQADKRNAERTKLSPTQQLEILNHRLGKDLGAKKERARLLKLIK